MIENKPKASNANLIALVVLGVLALGAAALILVLITNNGADENAARAVSSVGTVIDPPKPINDFTLTATSGDPLTLDGLNGKYTLIYFGYTHCPDACPTTLLKFRQIKGALTEDESAEMNFLFVSVDGERDTPELIDRYLERYDPAFIGLTGTDADLESLVADFGIFYEKRETGSDAGYLVDHTASTFLLNPDGKLIRVYSFTTSAADITTELRRLI